MTQSFIDESTQGQAEVGEGENPMTDSFIDMKMAEDSDPMTRSFIDDTTMGSGGLSMETSSEVYNLLTAFY